MRLPNGYGSIFVDKRSNRRKKYRALLPEREEPILDDQENIICNELGIPLVKKVRPTLGYYRTRQEALKALAEYNKDPSFYNAQTITFEKLYEMWSKIKYLQLQDKSINGYINAYKKCKNLYNVAIGDIKTEHIQNTIDSCNLGYMVQLKIKNIHIIQPSYLGCFFIET